VALPGRVIGLAGDLTRAEAESFAADLLPAAGTAPANLAPVFFPVTAQRPPEQVVHLPSLTQTYFALAATDISWSDPDYAASLLSNFVLGGHFFSRLYVALRHEGGETYGARVTRDVGHAAGPLALTTFTRSENTAATRDKLAGVLETFHDGGLTQTELDEAKSALAGQGLLRREKPGDILGTWTWEHARGLPPGFKDDSVLAAGQLTLDQVNAFIKKEYDPAAYTMVLLEAK
jgi:zinc protease